MGNKNRDDERGGCAMLDAGYSLLDTGCWILDAGYWLLEPDFDYMVLGDLHVESDSSGWCPSEKYENMR